MIGRLSVRCSTLRLSWDTTTRRGARCHRIEQRSLSPVLTRTTPRTHRSDPVSTVSITAVFFDVDFTLIYPGPTFDGEGYRRFGRRHGLEVDPSRFIQAVASASAELDQAQDDIYRPELFVRYARRVLEEMGGGGIGLDPCAREIYDEWAACQHFALYDDP